MSQTTGYMTDTTLEEIRTTATRVDLNHAFRVVFAERQERMLRHQCILRCDKLPEITGPGTTVYSLLTRIVDHILSFPPAESNLFIYVSEASETAEEDGTREITVHSNCTPDLHPEAAEEFRQQCENICNSLSGSFNQYMLSGSSCLITVKLPGK